MKTRGSRWWMGLRAITAFAAITTSATALPDLVVDRVVFNGSGQTITVRNGDEVSLDATLNYSWTVYTRNIGNAVAAASHTHTGWKDGSGNCAVLPVQYFLGNDSVPALAAGAEDSGGGTWLWGMDFAGAYSLVARADRDNVIGEGSSGEANNDFCATVNVVNGPSPLPDFVIDRFVFTHGGETIIVRHGDKVSLNAGVTYSWVVCTKNIGNAVAAASHTHTGWKDGSGNCAVLPVQYFLGNVAVPSLPAGIEHCEGATWEWGEEWVDTYALVARADRDNTVPEGPGEASNDFCATVNVVNAPLPDLVIDRVVFVGGGQTITIRDGDAVSLDSHTAYSWTVYTKNIGNANTPPSYTHVGWKDGVDNCPVLPVQYFLGNSAVRKLPFGAEHPSDGALSGTWIWGVDYVGTYSLVARADRDNAAVEGPAGEANNDFCATVSVIGPQPELQSLEIIGPSLVQQRSTAHYASLAHYSYGSTAPVPASWALRPADFPYASISDDGLLTTGDLSSDQWVRLVATYTDASGTKVARRDVRIGALPDLVGESFSASGNLEWGKKAYIQFSLRNLGGGEAAPCKIAFYIEDDAGHTFDLYNATSHVQAIRANEVSRQYSRQFFLPYAPPNSLPASGAVTIGMRIDAEDSVPESDETNNEQIGQGVDYARSNITTPLHPFVNGIVFDPREALWRDDTNDAVQRLRALGVDSARFWMNWCVVMQPGIPDSWQDKSLDDITDAVISDCARGVGEFSSWVDWSTYDSVVRTLRANGISPVPLICDGSAAPYFAGSNFRISPDDTDSECSTDIPSNDCDLINVEKRRHYRGIGEDAYLSLVRLFAGAAAKRYSSVDDYIELWNIENEPNWFPVHVKAAKWRCGDKWLDSAFVGRLLETMRDAVKLQGNPSARTTINWNVTMPSAALGTLRKLQPLADFLRNRLGLELSLWESYLKPVGEAGPWEDSVQAWSRHVDVIGLGFYPNYLHSWPVLGKHWAANTVAAAGDIARAINTLDPKPIVILETGYPSAPNGILLPAHRQYSEALQATYVDDAYNAAVVAGAAGFYVFRMEDFPPNQGTVEEREVEPHFGLVTTARVNKPAFDTYSSQIAANPTTAAIQTPSIHQLAAVTGSLIDSEQERIVATAAGLLSAVQNPGMLTTTFQSDRAGFPVTLRIAWGAGTVAAQLIDPAGNFVYQLSGATSPLQSSLRLPTSGDWQLQVWGRDMPGEGERALIVVSTERYSALDLNEDGDFDLADFRDFQNCFRGPEQLPGLLNCDRADIESDGDVDLNDFLALQPVFEGAP